MGAHPVAEEMGLASLRAPLPSLGACPAEGRSSQPSTAHGDGFTRQAHAGQEAQRRPLPLPLSPGCGCLSVPAQPRPPAGGRRQPGQGKRRQESARWSHVDQAVPRSPRPPGRGKQPASSILGLGRFLRHRGERKPREAAKPAREGPRGKLARAGHSARVDFAPSGSRTALGQPTEEPCAPTPAPEIK